MEKKLPKRSVAIVMDDHGLFATTFAMLLQQAGLFEEVHTFNNEPDVTQFLLRQPAKDACLFMDYFVPGSNPVHLIFNAKRFCPGIHIVVVSSLSSPGLIKKILSYNVNGFVGKTDGVPEVVACLAAIGKQEVFLSSSVRHILNDSPDNDLFNDFTPREMEVLIQSSWGKSIDEVAETLHLSKATVITHRRNLLLKSGLHSFTQLVALSIRSGIVPEK